MRVTTTLHFDGRCAAAFEFYEERLGAKLEFALTWGDSPMADQAPPEWGGKILHARLRIGDTELVGGDIPHGQHQEPRGFSILLGIDDPEEAGRTFAALAEGGTVKVPIHETFWAVRYGMVVDRFGIPWEVNCEQPQS